MRPVEVEHGRQRLGPGRQVQLLEQEVEHPAPALLMQKGPHPGRCSRSVDAVAALEILGNCGKSSSDEVQLRIERVVEVEDDGPHRCFTS